jgi:hypothetical protein
MFVWGGIASNSERSGGVYDPVADTWSATTLTGAPVARVYATAVWTGRSSGAVKRRVDPTSHPADASTS